MGIAPMVSCHSWHYRLCPLFFSISKMGYGSRPNQPHFFYKEVIMDEKRKERYHELDSLIHSDSFFRTY